MFQYMLIDPSMTGDDREKSVRSITKMLPRVTGYDSFITERRYNERRELEEISSHDVVETLINDVIAFWCIRCDSTAGVFKEIIEKASRDKIADLQNQLKLLDFETFQRAHSSSKNIDELQREHTIRSNVIKARTLKDSFADIAQAALEALTVEQAHVAITLFNELFPSEKLIVPDFMLGRRSFSDAERKMYLSEYRNVSFPVLYGMASYMISNNGYILPEAKAMLMPATYQNLKSIHDDAKAEFLAEHDENEGIVPRSPAATERYVNDLAAKATEAGL